MGVAAGQCSMQCLQQLSRVAEGAPPGPHTEDVWPPSSPDLCTMDYFFWSVLRAYSYGAFHSIKTSPHQLHQGGG